MKGEVSVKYTKDQIQAAVDNYLEAVKAADDAANSAWKRTLKKHENDTVKKLLRRERKITEIEINDNYRINYCTFDYGLFFRHIIQTDDEEELYYRIYDEGKRFNGRCFSYFVVMVYPDEMVKTLMKALKTDTYDNLWCSGDYIDFIEEFING